jgi:hypothetical protein
MISPSTFVFVFDCLCVYVDVCLYVVEPSGFRVLGFFRCLRRYLSINKHDTLTRVGRAASHSHKFNGKAVDLC